MKNITKIYENETDSDFQAALDSGSKFIAEIAGVWGGDCNWIIGVATESEVYDALSKMIAHLHDTKSEFGFSPEDDDIYEAARAYSVSGDEDGDFIETSL